MQISQPGSCSLYPFWVADHLFLCISYKLVARSRGLPDWGLFFGVGQDYFIGVVSSPVKKHIMSGCSLCTIRSYWYSVQRSIYSLGNAKWWLKKIHSFIYWLDMFIKKTYPYFLYKVDTSPIPLPVSCVFPDSVPWKNELSIFWWEMQDWRCDLGIQLSFYTDFCIYHSLCPTCPLPFPPGATNSWGFWGSVVQMGLLLIVLSAGHLSWIFLILAVFIILSSAFHFPLLWFGVSQVLSYEWRWTLF